MSRYPQNFNPIMERLVEIMQKKTQNQDTVFFRLVVSYFFAKTASMMRTHIVLPGEENIPVNMYAINLAPSGSGKGHSIRLMEQRVINGFRSNFLHHTFPKLAEVTLATIAARRANKNRTDPDMELNLAEAEFDTCGPLMFSFDSATAAAIKQMRTKLQMAGSGSMNFEIDEIGSNLLGQTEALNAFLELFDVGHIKPKLVKHTRENQRGEDLVDPTPTNAMMFGTPNKLMDGMKTEDEFNSMLETGYARRCYFGCSIARKQTSVMTPEELLVALDDQSDADYLSKISNRFTLLADPGNFNTRLEMQDDVQLEFLKYRMDCQERASKISEYQESKRAEMAHRHFKAAKLSAAYAFVDSAIYVEQDHWEQAVAMTEQSGEAFHRILKRDKAYVKLARFIAGTEELLTHADLVESLPFYRGSKADKAEMIDLAIGYGYKNGIYITRERGTDKIDFFSGKMLEQTDLSNIIVAWSNELAEGYRPEFAGFDQLHKLLQLEDKHWVNHHLMHGYRNEESVVPGCNVAVIDVEKAISIPAAQSLLKDFKWVMHTTKRHTDDDHRYRIVIPLSHKIELDAKDFKEFMKNLYSWLPFSCDEQTCQRARKWLTHKGNYWYNDGELLDSLQFIPKTKKAEERRRIISTQTNMSGIERWFVNQAEEGNRSNMMMQYGYFLIDQEQTIDEVHENIMKLNNKLENPLPETELLTTVIVTASKKIHTRDTGIQ